MKCGGRLIKPVDNDDERHFKVNGKHIHKPDARKLSTKRILSNIKRLAKTTHATAKEIIAESTTNVTVATAAALPSIRLMNKSVKRARVKVSYIPKQPKTLFELSLEGEFALTLNSENFILHDTGAYEEDQDDRTIIFGTLKNLDFLATCSEIFMDGTYKSAPLLFKQLYTLHGK